MQSEHRCFFVLIVGNMLLLWGIVFPPVSVAQTSEEGFIPVENPAAVLQMIADMSQSNYEKINTWQGRYRFSDTQYYAGSMASEYEEVIKEKLPKEFSLRTNGQVEFATDIAQHCLFLDYRVTDVSVVDMQLNLVKQTVPYELFHRISIITPEHYINFDPEYEHGSFIGFDQHPQYLSRAAFRDPVSASEHLQMSHIPDPRSFFLPLGRFLWENLRIDIQYLNLPEEEKKKIQKKSNVDGEMIVAKSLDEKFLIKKIATSQEAERIYKVVVDGNSGFNISEVYVAEKNRNSGHTIIVQWDIFTYQNISGTYLPMSVKQLRGHSDGKHFALVRIFTSETAKLNERIPAERFSFAATGLADGERVLDRISQKLYWYKDGHLVDDLHSAVSFSSNYLYVRIILIVFGLALIIYVLVKKVFIR